MSVVRHAARELRALARRLGLRRFWRARPIPSNQQLRPTDPATVRADVDYALGCGRHYRQRLEAAGVELRGARVLEIGPGTGFGAMAYLAVHGADVAVADRWLAPWQDGYHDAYYAATAEQIEADEPDADPAPIRRLAAARGYDGGCITLVEGSAERFPSLHDGAVSAIVSNAVLEHLVDLAAACRELHRVTRPGGLGLHQVDFRDHRDFDRPLEHLLLSPGAFARLSRHVHMEYGSQARRSDYARALTDAGFVIESYASNLRASDAYLDDLEPRLRKASQSPYTACPREDLADLSGLFLVRRPS